MSKLANKDFDIVSVVYNASQAIETCGQYVQDAAREGDREAEQFFREVQEKNETFVSRGRDLLKSRLQ